MREYGILSLPASPYNTSGKYEMGWQFTVNESISVWGLRVYLPDAQTVVGHLWDSGSSAIRTVTIIAAANKWSEALFDTPVTLNPGTTYTISCYNESNRYYTQVSNVKLNSKINYVSGVYNSSRNSKPYNRETSYIYPFIDILINEKKYKPSGTVIFEINDYIISGDEALYWTAETPQNTNVKLYAKVNNGSFVEISTSGGMIPNIPSDSETCDLYIKAELSTTDIHYAPKLLAVSIGSNINKKVLVLSLAIPDISHAVGDISISYDGLGGLQGLGGPSDVFSGEFTPDVEYKFNPNFEEHVETNLTATVLLRAVSYYNTQEIEHLGVSISSTIVLTNIHDL